MYAAALIGVRRYVESLFDGRQDYMGMRSWQSNIEGSCGELAAAKALRIYWGATVNTFKAADLGDDIQIRTRSRDYYELNIKPNDPFWNNLQICANLSKENPTVWLEMRQIYGDLAHNSTFVDMFANWLSMIWDDGLEATLKVYLSA